MTRDELIENIIATIIENPPTTTRVRDAGFLEYTEKVDHSPTAVAVADTIFAALKDSTEQMDDAARHLMMWLAYDRPTGHALHFMHKRMRKPLPEGCQDIDHVPPKAQQSAWIWQAMLAASPLAPEGGRE